ncbi:uncharacterized protein LOC109835296 [Asparagus officinalis]|uniref:uncharacterized protein LOC109835296 n=1 Tax=Asparagus officinalis TaxID=4686 RepID=UPI00098E1D6E|nr:uncharacterized protein LOC109835296 [Asparagus officinalis]
MVNEGILLAPIEIENRIWPKIFTKPEDDSSIAPPPSPTRRHVEDQLMKLVQSTDRQDVKDFVLLQILYQLSMIWCPSSVLSIPKHLFKYVDSIKHANNTAWGTYIFSDTFNVIEKALKGLGPGKKIVYLQGCTQLVCLWHYKLTSIKKPVVGSMSRTPLSNWAKLGDIVGSLRLTTVIAKARQATIKLS